MAPVDDFVYGQPLYLYQIGIAGVTRNVVISCTMNNSVYAFDADAGSQLWTVNLGPPVPSLNYASNYPDMYGGNNGILSTPTIDRANDRLFVVAATYSNGSYAYTLHALSLQNGADKRTPVTISGSDQGVTFDAFYHIQRVALTIHPSLNQVLVAFTSHSDITPYYGWLFSYDASTLAQIAVLNMCPGGGGSIWQSGGGLVVDETGEIYATTANAAGGNEANTQDRANSVVRIHPTASSLSITDWFLPPDYQSIDASDADMGVCNTLMIPGSNLVLGGRKDGVVYAVDRTNMGQMNGNPQQIQASSSQPHTIAYCSSNNSLYIGPAQGNLTQITYGGGASGTFSSPVSQTSDSAGFDPAISSNQGSNPVLWCNHVPNGSDNHTVQSGSLVAYDANNLATLLYSSDANSSRDALGNYAKWSRPTIANGRVYMSTFSNYIACYGFITPPPAHNRA